MTEAMPQVAPISPAYLPRLQTSQQVARQRKNEAYSCRDTMSEMVICTIWMMPPPPMPCTARQTTSQIMDCAAPHSAEPI
jgi:hypothetical protein